MIIWVKIPNLEQFFCLVDQQWTLGTTALNTPEAN
jgi:hypothetical protein